HFFLLFSSPPIRPLFRRPSPLFPHFSLRCLSVHTPFAFPFLLFSPCVSNNPLHSLFILEHSSSSTHTQAFMAGVDKKAKELTSKSLLKARKEAEQRGEISIMD